MFSQNCFSPLALSPRARILSNDTSEKELLKKFDEQGTQRILQVKQKLIHLEKDSKAERNSHPLMKKITEWELDSTSKIHRMAEEARGKVQKLLDENLVEYQNEFELIKNKLEISQGTHDFKDIDFINWLFQLEELQQKLEVGESNIRAEVENEHWTPKIDVVKTTKNDKEE
ncbi:unnamed protein product [Didymodactylos carnosus]|uniref:Uncharacterized protein n=1 Tax=Didymodactylos carnosus TaxID=1234261 RepID=A0A815HY09_9BILA|nr:unnamed protein product [Didymodactylos carnosus]CAF4235410.1 unnamed protein product [Didymodactylos carnosus]